MTVDLLDRRLLFVTGKGGVGKTTVASALALLAAQQGKRVLVGEVEPKGDLAAAFETDPLAFAPRQIAPNLHALSLSTEASLREYLGTQLRIPMLGRIGPLARTFDFVASAAPGVREVLTVGKFVWEVRERHYDLVVVDAAASGHVVAQLSAPMAINDLIKVGPVRDQTGWMLDILGDPHQTGAVIVALPEEMPVNETIELAGRIGAETPVDLAGIVANRVLPELFGRAEEEVFERLQASGGIEAALADSGQVGPGAPRVVEAAALAVRLRRTRARHLARLQAEAPTAVPLVYVPELFARDHGLRAIRQVAEALGAELGVGA